VTEAANRANICSHMGERGSAYARLKRSLATGNPTIAWAAAAELDRVPLDDALALLLMLVGRDTERLERASARWLGRACLELEGLRLPEAQLIAAALASLDSSRAGAAVALAEICDRHGLREAVKVLDRFGE
jgi:hypothetical protein